MEHIPECVVCDASIWPVAHGYLCYQHRIIHARLLSDQRMLEALRQVSFGERSDFPASRRSHTWHQLVGVQKSQHWTVELDDILRAYGVHYEQEREGGAGHDESEAA